MFLHSAHLPLDAWEDGLVPVVSRDELSLEELIIYINQSRLMRQERKSNGETEEKRDYALV